MRLLFLSRKSGTGPTAPRYLLLGLLAGLLYPARPTWAQVTVTTRSPARHAAAAAPNASVALTFSQAVTAASAANIRVMAAQSGRRQTAATVAGPVVTLDPTADFQPGETVSVTVPATVQTAGGASATPHVYQFSVGATGGAGHFAFWQRLDTLDTSGQMADAAAADVNGDGHTDLVSISATTTLAGQLNVNLGDGTGNYAPAVVQPLFDGPAALAVGDVDGDGDPDALVAGSGSAGAPNPCQLLRNDGSGTFAAGVALPTAFGVRTLTLGDLDADGDLDLVAGPDQTGNTTVLLNDGTGTFTVGGTLNTLTDASLQYLADVDNDGDLDLLHRPAGGSTARLALNDGTGSFATPTLLNFSLALPPCDLNADGKLDLVARLLSPAGMQVYLGSGSGTFAPQAAVGFVGGGNQAGLRLALADADGDGAPDVVAAFVQGAAKFILARNNGSGLFAAGAAQAMPLPTSFVLRLLTADADGDGDLDLLAPTSDQGSLLLLRNAPPGATGLAADVTPSRLTVYPNPAAGSATLTWSAAADGQQHPIEVVLLDALGRLVRHQPIATGNTALELRDLPSGVYVVRAGERVARLVVE